MPNSNANEIKRYKSHWAAYDVLRHLYHFQKSSIKSIADKYGFVVEKINPISNEIRNLLKDKKYLDDILYRGYEKANLIAVEKIKKIHEIVGF